LVVPLVVRKCFTFRAPRAELTRIAAAIFFTTYSQLKQSLPIAHTHPLNHVISASLGEVAACLVRVPTEVVKSRTQTAAYGAGVSSFGALMRVANAEGLGGLYRGFGSTIMREVCFVYISQPRCAIECLWIDSLHVTSIPYVRVL
jgi:hypothetical protein